ncbi:MAG TPA: hypothetical protein VH309_05765 [Elusimicrobiota bacterium]|jgi:hypothetical protein|nr:hypothetical protein [Elusimicrobiota bacterium]
MPAPKVAFVDFLDALERLNPGSGETHVRVGLDGGRESSFLVATFDRPEAWMKAGKASHWFAEPVLYVRRLDEATVRAAVAAMAADLGGYWLRYYRSAPGQPSKIGVGMAAVDRVAEGCGVVEAVLKDGREFSILSATPSWWRAELDRRKLPFYFGPMVLFVTKLDAAHAKRASKLMAETDEQLFCRYDTPRKTLPQVLDDFQALHR